VACGNPRRSAAWYGAAVARFTKSSVRSITSRIIVCDLESMVAGWMIQQRDGCVLRDGKWASVVMSLLTL